MLFYWFYINEENVLFSYATSLIFLNIYTYILLGTVFFMLLFNFNINIFKSLNFFKILNITNFFKYTTICFLFSISGVPPFFGFFTKFIYLSLSLRLTSWFVILFFLGFNLFIIFFYLQNLKYLNVIDNLVEDFFNIQKFYMTLNFKLIFYINTIQFINLFGLFF